MRFILFVFLAIFTLPTLHAQTLTGTISDSEGLPISFANILVKEADQPQNISEFVQAKEGKYTLKLIKNYQKLRVDVVAFSYAPDSIIILNPKKDSIYTLNFRLRLVEQDLKEVVVVGKQTPFTEKEDTVSYNVSA